MYNPMMPYNPYQVQMQQMQLQQQMQQMQQPMPTQYSVVKVSGENGAKAFQMAPNSSIILMDETAPIVWLKTTDGAGYPTITPYTITPYEAEPSVDTKSLEARVSKLEEIINAKSNVSSIKRNSKQAEADE